MTMTMETLLAFNDDAALVGDWEGQVRTKRRPADVASDEWIPQLRSEYGEPEHWYKDAEGAPFSHFTGGYWHEPNGQMNVEVLEGIKPYEAYSDDTSGLAVR